LEKYDTIVIGSGIGGLAIGAILVSREREHKVLILEKNNSVGGRLFSYEKEGFKLDIGAHVFSRSNKGPVGEILRLVGKEDSIDFTYVRPLTSYQGKLFPFPRGLQGIVPDKDFERLNQMFGVMMSLSPPQTEELEEVDLYSYVQRFTDNGLINACINNICMVYLVVPYYRASAGEFIRCIQVEARTRASGYPLGGCGAVAELIASGIKALGGVIETNAKVDRIIVENSVAKGVVVGGKTYLADNIISNADIKHTMLDLVGEDKLDEHYLNQIRPLEYSYSALVVRLALDKVLADWKLITHIASDDPVGYHKALEEGKVPDGLSAFLPVPSNFAPDVAPEGKQLLTVATAVPYDFPHIESLKQILLDLAQHFLPEIKKHIMWVDVTTPSDINKFVGENGAVIGVAQTVTQSGRNRPSFTTPIQNLYLCGGEAGGWGVGVELAVESARSLSLFCPLSGEA